MAGISGMGGFVAPCALLAVLLVCCSIHVAAEGRARQGWLLGQLWDVANPYELMRGAPAAFSPGLPVNVSFAVGAGGDLTRCQPFWPPQQQHSNVTVPNPVFEITRELLGDGDNVDHARLLFLWYSDPEEQVLLRQYRPADLLCGCPDRVLKFMEEADPALPFSSYLGLVAQAVGAGSASGSNDMVLSIHVAPLPNMPDPTHSGKYDVTWFAAVQPADVPLLSFRLVWT